MNDSLIYDIAHIKGEINKIICKYDDEEATRIIAKGVKEYIDDEVLCD